MLFQLLLLSGVALADDTGSLRVSAANGPGGRIFVDNVDSGIDAPGTVPGVAVGNHMIEIRGDCLKGQEQIDVAGGRLNEVSLRMEAFDAFAQISVSPASATVTLDGDPLSTPADMPLACGEHVIIAYAPGYAEERREVKAEAGAFYQYKFELIKDGFGSVQVDVTPDNARILVDGEEVATGDQTVNQLSAGSHVVAAQAEGFKPAEQMVEIVTDETTQLVLNLEAVRSLTPAGPGDGTPNPQTKGRTRRIIGGATAIVGVGALGYGSYSLLQAQQVYDNEYLLAYEAGGCGNQIATDFAQCEKADLIFQNDIKGPKALGLTMMGVGAVLMGGGGAMLVIDDQGAWLGYSGRF